ncbi:hypothetical protein SAMN04487904_102495 [Actinopolyspora lacussalsi subsp. righensis]|uniref:Uncharacterized protein n=1 Tax=Actinopolyspora righensis TaxID=995060 RepID=A0A1I6YFT8_9ACTN|nr:DUF6346 domain-containing protein [Actinopolyspora righensis]SFT49260.1 hypothetical protein SAMN04487904_102495 [Actinopolyspora righensis]
MRVVRVVRDVLLIPVGMVLFLSGIFVVIPLFGIGAAGSEVTARGTAVAQQCRFDGPITESDAPERGYVVGFGYICQARVTWRDGTTEMWEVSGSQLKPGDVGEEVAVVRRAIADGGAGTTTTRPEVFRADYEPNRWLGVPVMLAVMLFGIVVGGPACSRLYQTFSGKESAVT